MDRSQLQGSFQDTSFGMVPDEVNIFEIFCRLSLKDLQSVVSSNKYLYNLLSSQAMDPVWEDFLMRYFPDSYFMYQEHSEKPIKKKGLLKQFLEGNDNLHQGKHRTEHLFRGQTDVKLSTQHAVKTYFPEGNQLGVWDLTIGKKVKSIDTNKFQYACIRKKCIYVLQDGILNSHSIENMKLEKQFICYSSKEDVERMGIDQLQLLCFVNRDWIISSYLISLNKWGIKTWNKETGIEGNSLEIKEGKATSLISHKNLVYIGLNNGIILIWDFIDGVVVRNLQHSNREITFIDVDAEFLCFADLGIPHWLFGRKTDLVIWSLEDGLPVKKLNSPFIDVNIQKMELRDHHLYVLIDNLGKYTLKVWDLKRDKIVSIDPGVCSLSKDYPITSLRVFDGLIVLQLSHQNYKFLDFLTNVTT
jgi:hypothetical protein